MRTIAVIPARYRSNRLPGKPLAEILGRTMIEHVYRRARQARLVDEVLVATDDLRILETVQSFGGDAVMTSKRHQSGTDRVAEAVRDLPFELVVNLQGDEPLIAPDAIDEAVEVGRQNPGAIATLSNPLTSLEELEDRNVVKVVCDREGFALYFSRAPIPAIAQPGGAAEERLLAGSHYKHIGIYVFPKPLLLQLTTLSPTPLERAERLEQLRAIEHGFSIRVRETHHESLSVDTAEDLERVRRVVAQQAVARDSRVDRVKKTSPHGDAWVR